MVGAASVAEGFTAAAAAVTVVAAAAGDAAAENGGGGGEVLSPAIARYGRAFLSAVRENLAGREDLAKAHLDDSESDQL